MKTIWLAFAVFGTFSAAGLAQSPFGAPATAINIRIGHVGPLSGNLRNLGQDTENGVRLAIDAANAAGIRIGGQAVHFTLVSEDDQGNPDAAVGAAQRLLAAKVAGVVGHLSSAASMRASVIYSQAGVPVISPSATNPRLTDFGARTQFRVIGRDDQTGPAIANYLVSTGRARVVAVVSDGSSYSGQFDDSIEARLKANNVEVLPRVQVKDASEGRAALASLQLRRPDAVFFSGDTPATLMKQARELGINALFLTGELACNGELITGAGPAAEGALCVESGIPINAAAASFVQAHTARFNAGPLLYSPFAYDAASLLIEAMKKADSTDPSRYVGELRTLSYAGATGRIAFDEKGDRRNPPMTIYGVKGARLEPVAIISGVERLTSLTTSVPLPNLVATASSASPAFFAAAPAATAAAVRLRAQSNFPSSDIRHAAFLEVARELSAKTGGAINLEVLPAGAVAPSFAALDAVAKKTLDAAWVSPGTFFGKDPTFSLIEGTPFGLEADRYADWRSSRNASEIVDRFYRRFGVIGVACGVTAPHGDIWATKSIASVDDLRRLRIRVAGIFITLFAKVGALPNSLSFAETPQAMQRGLLDAAMLLDPGFDLSIGMAAASRAYFVSELHAARGQDLIFNVAAWEALAPDVRNTITTTCQANLRKMARGSAALAASAMNEIRKSVSVYAMPDSVTQELRSAWNEVRADEGAKNATFAQLAATMAAYEGARAKAQVSSGAATASAGCRDPLLEPGRFRVQGVEMTDSRNGLVWLRCPAGYVAPNGACDSSAVLPSTNWRDAMLGPLKTPQTPPGNWRLASIEELESITAKGCSYSLNDKYIEIMLSSIWSSSAADNDMVWILREDARLKVSKTPKDPKTGGEFFGQTLYVRDAAGRP